MEKINALLKELFESETLIKAVLGDPRKKSLPYRRVTIRPVLLKGALCYQAEYSYEKKAIHENLSAEEAHVLCLELILRDFKQINFFTEKEEVQILAARPDKPKVIRRKAEKNTCAKESLSHNRNKQYLLPDGEPCDFLIRLGVMDETGKVYQKHYSKFRQINRYLEIVSDVLCYLPRADAPLKIIDFGCGKAYLTFALYYYLKKQLGYNVEIIGLDLKEDVIRFCNQVATDLQYGGLSFLMGDIADYTSDHADMVVTLHACDTATDYALINAVAWKSKVILSVPCCQHELFSQITNDLHQPMFKHGILKDRFTELLTDSLRGLKLEAAGYDVSMIEFTSLEHTSKNILIRAVRTNTAAPRQQKAKKEYEALRDAYGVNPAIEQLV